MKNKENKVCFLDFETTGSNLFHDDPIQVGALIVDLEINEIVGEFESYIKPSTNSTNSEAAFNIHNIRISDLNNAPNQEQVLEEFFKKFGTDYCFGGWNISFDVPFFKKICNDNGYTNLYNKISYRHIDVQSIFRFLKLTKVIDPNLFSLSDFASYFKIPRNTRHNALQDVYVTYNVFMKALELLNNKKEIDQNLFIQ